MKRFATIGFVLLLAATTLGGPAGADVLSNRPALDFSGPATTDSAGENTAFARSVEARYGAGVTVSDVLADARAQGFACSADASSCTRSIMDGPCFTAWIIDIGPAGTVSGRHTRQCMGAEEE